MSDSSLRNPNPAARATASAASRCPLCGGVGGERAFPYGTVWNGRQYDHLSCTGCHGTFVHPLPSEADFSAMYSRASYHDEFYGEVCEETFTTSLGKVAHLLQPSGRMLDFGCGNGAFLIAGQRAGFVCDGVELEASAIREAAAVSGCDVFDLPTAIEAGRRYDAIHLGDVLEHLADPAATMRQLEALLNDGGRFFVEGPLEDNRSIVLYASRLFGWVKKLRGKPLHGSYPPFHLFRATARGQRNFFEARLGYAIVDFSVQETGWPYANDGDSLFRARSASRFLRIAIARAAVALFTATKWMPLHIGNRFIAIVAPPVSDRQA